jgi:hypothetical protein
VSGSGCGPWCRLRGHKAREPRDATPSFFVV